MGWLEWKGILRHVTLRIIFCCTWAVFDWDRFLRRTYGAVFGFGRSIYVIPSPQLNKDQKKKKKFLAENSNVFFPKSGEDQKKALRRTLKLYLAGIDRICSCWLALFCNRGQTYKWRWRHLQAQVAPLATSGGATSKFKWRHLLV